MAALPDAESSGIVSLVLETAQPGGVVVEGGWGVSSSGATRGWVSPEGAAGVGDVGCTMFSESQPARRLISHALSGTSQFLRQESRSQQDPVLSPLGDQCSQHGCS